MEEILTGQTDHHVTPIDTNAPQVKIHKEALSDFLSLQAHAKSAGFHLQVASGFRSFERQLIIWNEKATGKRPLCDDHGKAIDASSLSEQELVHAIMRFSALPGASRHHWGTDIDVFDAANVSEDYRVELSIAEVSAGGPFFEFHNWLDEQIDKNANFGFYRPYDQDRGGVSPERWHLSYAPLSADFFQQYSFSLFEKTLTQTDLQLTEVLLNNARELFDRYISNVTVR